MDRRNELVWLAALTSADVQVVEEHEGLQRAGGVVALLRYRPDQAPTGGRPEVSDGRQRAGWDSNPRPKD